MVSEAHCMSSPCTELLLFNYAKGNTCCNFSCLKDVELCPTVVDTWHLKYPVQCVDNCDGRDGQVVFDSESFHNSFHFISQPNISIQCQENPEGEDGIVVFESELFPNHFQYTGQPNTSVQCLENPEGKDGVVVIGRESFPMLLSHLSSGRP